MSSAPAFKEQHVRCDNSKIAEYQVNMMVTFPLIQYPVLLGGAAPMFAGEGTPRPLALLGNEQWSSGATIQRHRFALGGP